MTYKQNIYQPSPVYLDSFTKIRRIATRPLSERDDNFDSNFDDNTLFYDCFWSFSGKEIILLGPPLFNLKKYFSKIKIVSYPSHENCSFKIRNLDRHAQIWVQAPKGTTHLSIKSKLGDIHFPINKNISSLFLGMRVLMTKSKNNELIWIKDWITFNTKINKANAVILYDNGSENYTVEDIAESIKSIDNNITFVIVKWPFKFGPQGTLKRGTWDSDFCEQGVYEHARRLYLSKAASVLNSDIDELTIKNGKETIFEAVEKSFFGVITFYGRWMRGIKNISPDTVNEEIIRHKDYKHVLYVNELKKYYFLKHDTNRSPTIWATVPSRCPDFTQWKTHSIANWLPSRFISDKFSYRHFREISTNWKYIRTGNDREVFDPERHIKDQQLLNCYKDINWSE